MFNVTVINVKKSIKHMIILIIMLLLMLSVTKFDTKINKSEISKINISEKLIQCLNMEIPAIEYSYYNSNNTLKEDKEENEESIIGKILDIELSKVQNKEKEIEEVQKELPQTQDVRVDLRGGEEGFAVAVGGVLTAGVDLHDEGGEMSAGGEINSGDVG